MVQDFAAELGNSILSASYWQPVNDFENLTSAIPPSRNLQYSLWNSTTDNINYTFLRYNHDIANPVIQFSKALDYYFRPNIFSYPAFCTYPISSQYGFLNRLLFYILMIFTLVMRRHKYLATAALGTAMTYAASTAVHSFALQNKGTTHASDYGDLDLEGIFPILEAGCIMLTPILNWSNEIRLQTRIIIVCWGAADVRSTGVNFPKNLARSVSAFRPRSVSDVQY
ncbi:MAG: hypothetical protein Q9201_004243 [Fulgogasparrea decipioides]